MMDMTRGHIFDGTPVACTRCGDPWPEGFLPHRECPQSTRTYTVRLTSDDVTSEQRFDLTPAEVVFLLNIAAKFNAAATFSVDHCMFIEPESAATQGEVA